MSALRSSLRVLCVAGSFAGNAHARDVALGYRIYYGGFEVMGLGVDLALSPSRYALQMKFHTLGLIGRMFPWKMRAYSRGRMVGANVRPLAAGQRNAWRGRERWVDIRFDDGRPVVTDARPKSEGTDAPGKDLRGTVDLASAILVIARATDRDRACAGRVKVFDGRRRYDLVLEKLGEEKLRKNGYSIYQGPTVTCRAEMDRLGGFKRRKSYGGWGRADRAARVWLGRVMDRVPRVPVRIEIDTRWGAVIAHLARVNER